ncbi:hypothetical protein ILFOPFJJ_01852 [Ensifer psoraleae]|nr:hypothetical protein [Sinorhizobium psoraleae]
MPTRVYGCCEQANGSIAVLRVWEWGRNWRRLHREPAFPKIGASSSFQRSSRASAWACISRQTLANSITTVVSGGWFFLTSSSFIAATAYASKRLSSSWLFTDRNFCRWRGITSASRALPLRTNPFVTVRQMRVSDMRSDKRHEEQIKLALRPDVLHMQRARDSRVDTMREWRNDLLRISKGWRTNELPDAFQSTHAIVISLANGFEEEINRVTFPGGNAPIQRQDDHAERDNPVRSESETHCFRLAGRL